MAVKTNQHEARFFVYVIESPSPEDLFTQTQEGTILESALRLAGVACVPHLVISRKMFEHALGQPLLDAYEKRRGHVPIIHLSGHGTTSGIALSNGDFVSWDDLRRLFLPVNKAFEENVILCLSSCEGFHAAKAAMSTEDGNPFFGIVGPSGRPTWAETALAYGVFYHLLSKGTMIQDAIAVMNETCPGARFGFVAADEARRAWTDRVKAMEEKEATGRLREAYEAWARSRRAPES